MLSSFFESVAVATRPKQLGRSALIDLLLNWAAVGIQATMRVADCASDKGLRGWPRCVGRGRSPLKRLPLGRCTESRAEAWARGRKGGGVGLRVYDTGARAVRELVPLVEGRV